MKDLITQFELIEIIKSEVDKAGTQSKFAESIGYGNGVISRFASGQRPPTEHLLDYLGFEKVVMYRKRRE